MPFVLSASNKLHQGTELNVQTKLELMSHGGTRHNRVAAGNWPKVLLLIREETFFPLQALYQESGRDIMTVSS